MRKTFIIRGGGQAVQQFAQKTIFNKMRYPLIVEVKETDWPIKARCEGQNNYTNAIWATDLDTVQRWADEWAGEEVKLTLQTI